MSSKKQRNAARRKPERREPAALKPLPARRLWSLATLSDTPLAALALTLMVYLRCIGNAFVYDDNEMILINRSIGDWAMMWRSFVNDSWWFRNPQKLPQSAYYRPLQDVWLSANYHLFGFAPPGWHLMTIAVHLIAVWLVFRIARELTDTRWTPDHRGDAVRRTAGSCTGGGMAHRDPIADGCGFRAGRVPVLHSK